MEIYFWRTLGAGPIQAFFVFFLWFTYNIRSNAIQYFFSISQSSSDLGGESSLGGKDRLAFPQFVTAIARIAEEIVLKDHLVATMSERLHYLCQHLEQKIQRYEKTGGGCCWVFVFVVVVDLLLLLLLL